MTEQPPRLDDLTFERLAEHIQGLLETIEALPYPRVQEQMLDLLNSIDLLHREALVRLVELIDARAPNLRRPMADDFAIQTLLMLYGFVPVEEAPAVPSMATFIPLAQLDTVEPVKMPVWIPAGRIDDLAPGGVQSRELEGVRIVLCRVDHELYAMEDHCLDSILPLDLGRTDGYFLVCPWHACRYDMRTGEIQDGSGRRLQTFPVAIGADGRCRVGFNIPPHALPVQAHGS